MVYIWKSVRNWKVVFEDVKQEFRCIRNNFATETVSCLFDMESNDVHDPDKPTEQTTKRVMRRQIVWRNAVGFLFLHLAALYGLYVSVTSAKILTWVYGKLKTYNFVTFLLC